MDERKINSLLLITAVVSLIILILTGKSECIDIEEINENYLGKYVCVKIKIDRYVLKSDFALIKPSESNISIVFFENEIKANMDKFLKLEKNKTVLIEGQVKKYKGSLEIIGRKIEYV